MPWYAQAVAALNKRRGPEQAGNAYNLFQNIANGFVFSYLVWFVL